MLLCSRSNDASSKNVANATTGLASENVKKSVGVAAAYMTSYANPQQLSRNGQLWLTWRCGLRASNEGSE